MREVLLAKAVIVIGELDQLGDGFSLPKTACLTFLRPAGMDITMVLHGPQSRLAMDTASRG